MNIACTTTFNWHDDEDLVVAEQLAIAIYKNQMDGIVIRQERSAGDDADAFIIVRPEHARRVAEAIIRAAGDMLALPPPSKHKPNSANCPKDTQSTMFTEVTE